MRVTEIRDFIDRRPFLPFRVWMSDGTVHLVRNPSLVLVTKHTVIIGVPRADEVIPEDAMYCDPVHITRVETMESEPPAA